MRSSSADDMTCEIIHWGQDRAKYLRSVFPPCVLSSNYAVDAGPPDYLGDSHSHAPHNFRRVSDRMVHPLDW